MKFILNFLLHHFLFAGALFFASGAAAITGDGGDGGDGAGGGDGALGGYEGDAGDDGALDDADADADAALDGADKDQQQVDDKTVIKEETELGEFKGAVSARLKGLVSKSPKLAEAFKENPKLQEQIEATFRREAALRDVFPTVAEARQMREQFPNGLADVNTLLEDVKEVEQLDSLFYTRDGEGHYQGHVEMLGNMFKDDSAATVALLKAMPTEWAKLDRASYNEVMGSIIGATFAQKEIPQYISELAEMAKDPKNATAVESGLRKLLGFAESFTKGKAQPTEAERNLSDREKAFQRTQQQSKQTEGQQFNRTFVGESKKLQLGIIAKHPAIAKLEKATGVTPQKRAEVIEKVRTKIEQFLGKSPSFMRKLRPAHAAGKLQDTLDLQKAAWSQSWLLNKMVRDVLRVETPAIVQNNRDAVRRRAGTPAAKTTPKTGGDKTSKGPRQIAGRWYREDGTPFTTSEVLSGKHLSA
jgi:hypothetical protein